jgi:hypothetical protein
MLTVGAGSGSTIAQENLKRKRRLQQKTQAALDKHLHLK